MICNVAFPKSMSLSLRMYDAVYLAVLMMKCFGKNLYRSCGEKICQKTTYIKMKLLK